MSFLFFLITPNCYLIFNFYYMWNKPSTTLKKKKGFFPDVRFYLNTKGATLPEIQEKTTTTGNLKICFTVFQCILKRNKSLIYHRVIQKKLYVYYKYPILLSKIIIWIYEIFHDSILIYFSCNFFIFFCINR